MQCPDAELWEIPMSSLSGFTVFLGGKKRPLPFSIMDCVLTGESRKDG